MRRHRRAAALPNPRGDMQRPGPPDAEEHPRGSRRVPVQHGRRGPWAAAVAAAGPGPRHRHGAVAAGRRPGRGDVDPRLRALRHAAAATAPRGHDPGDARAVVRSRRAGQEPGRDGHGSVVPGAGGAHLPAAGHDRCVPARQGARGAGGGPRRHGEAAQARGAAGEAAGADGGVEHGGWVEERAQPRDVLAA